MSGSHERLDSWPHGDGHWPASHVLLLTACPAADIQGCIWGFDEAEALAIKKGLDHTRNII